MLNNSLQLLQIDSDDKRAERPLFINSIISLHNWLDFYNYPKNSADNMLKCGQSTGLYMTRTCSCKSTIMPLNYHCNLRVCPQCSKIRKRRIIRKYLPFLQSLHQDRTNFLYFLTISPKNYSDLKFGLKDVKDTFSKFIRLKYIKERVKGGFYVIETKGGKGNWNIHMHVIMYGRFLDNRLRGFCNKCGQNLLKYDYFTKGYHCANRKCCSLDVVVKEDSKLVRLWKSSSGGDVHMHIQRQGSSLYTLNYMCKYVSSNKDDFFSVKDLALYMCASRTHRLISSFGDFYRVKFVKFPFLCKDCGDVVHFSLFLDSELTGGCSFTKHDFKPPMVQPQKTLRVFLVSAAEPSCKEVVFSNGR